jgi:hypothetical protein
MAPVNILPAKREQQSPESFNAFIFRAKKEDQNGKSGLFIFPIACYVTAWLASVLH